MHVVAAVAAIVAAVPLVAALLPSAACCTVASAAAVCYVATLMTSPAALRDTFRWERIWMDPTCQTMGGKAGLKLWAKRGCLLWYTQMVPKWLLDGQVAETDFGYKRTRHSAQNCFHFGQQHKFAWIRLA